MGNFAGVNSYSLNVPEKTWYVLFTKPRAEKLVYERLVQIGVEAFLPMYTTLRQWSDRKKKVELPLFSSYVFVHIGAKEYLSVLQTQGSVKYVSFNGVPARMRQLDIDNLKILTGSKHELEVSDRKFKSGQRVIVTFGILKDLIGELIECGNTKRFLLRIDSIGQNLLVKVPANYLTGME